MNKHENFTACSKFFSKKHNVLVTPDRHMDRGKSMKRIVLVMAFLFAACGSANGQDISGIWPGIQTIEVDKTLVGVVRYSYNPKLTQIVNREITDNESMPKVILVAKARLYEGSKEFYLIVYCEGPSVDPVFIVYKGENT
jgi:hypothetical protein